MRKTYWFDNPEVLLPIAVKVYKTRLAEDAGGSPEYKAGAADRMIAKDGDSGEKLSNRAHAYIPIVRATLIAIEWEDLHR